MESSAGRGRRLRLLMIAPYPVLPLVAGGKIRIVQLARALSELGLEVTVVAPFHFRQRPRLLDGERFELRAVKYPFIVPFLLTGRPFPYGYLVSFHSGYRVLLRHHLDGFDVCQLEHPAFVDLCEDIRPAKTPIVYDAQNVEYDYVRSESPHASIQRIAGRRIYALEKRAIERSAHVFACSEEDKGRFVELYGAAPERISLLPNGVDRRAVDAQMVEKAPPPERFPGLSRFPRRALFSGSAVEHNFAAVRYILDRLAPQLRGEVAFVIHGHCGRGFERRRGANLFFDPDHENLRAWAIPGTVAINPVNQGSGTSLKLLQYLAYGLPVVSTEFGMRGFEDLKPLVTTASLENFAAALRADHRPPSDAREMLEKYEWRNIARRARDIYVGLVERQARRRTKTAARLPGFSAE